MSAKSDIKVGLFVLLGLLLAGFVIFLIGDERRLFDGKQPYKAEFQNVDGLNRGAPVRMGGLRIGVVSKVAYGAKAGDATIYVDLDIVAEAAGRIRSDSVAAIVNKGLLGDKMIAITPGKKGKVLKPGETITSKEPDDLFGRVDDIAGTAKTTMEDVSKLASELRNEELHRDLRKTVHGLSQVMHQVSEGEGYPNRLLTSKEEADRLSRTIDNLDKASVELRLTLREVRGAVHQVRVGPGFGHDMLYGEGAKKEIGQFGDAAGELALTLKGIRTGNGFAHDVLFGGDDKRAGDALSNVTQMTADMRDIVRGLKQGKGTLGALLVDPSIYEDVKRLLGNVQRNNVLRALVRYSIKKDAPPASSKVTPPAPKPGPAPAAPAPKAP